MSETGANRADSAQHGTWRPIGAPELPPVTERRTVKAPGHFRAEEVLREVAEAHDVEIVELRRRSGRLRYRDHLSITMVGDPMSLAEYWRDVHDVFPLERDSRLAQAFGWLVALTD